MRLTPDQKITLYAISTLKLPLVVSIAQLIGIDVKDVRWRLTALTDGGYLERKAYGTHRAMFLLTLLGQATVQKYVEEHGAPTLGKLPRPPRVRTKREPEEREPLENVATPRQVSWKGTEYTSPSDGAYYRNDGNKHVKSRGAF